MNCYYQYVNSTTHYTSFNNLLKDHLYAFTDAPLVFYLGASPVSNTSTYRVTEIAATVGTKYPEPKTDLNKNINKFTLDEGTYIHKCLEEAMKGSHYLKSIETYVQWLEDKKSDFLQFFRTLLSQVPAAAQEIKELQAANNLTLDSFINKDTGLLKKYKYALKDLLENKSIESIIKSLDSLQNTFNADVSLKTCIAKVQELLKNDWEVWDTEYKLAYDSPGGTINGTIDLILYNQTTKKYKIIDYKTSHSSSGMPDDYKYALLYMYTKMLSNDRNISEDNIEAQDLNIYINSDGIKYGDFIKALSIEHLLNVKKLLSPYFPLSIQVSDEEASTILEQATLTTQSVFLLRRLNRNTPENLKRRILYKIKTNSSPTWVLHSIGGQKVPITIKNHTIDSSITKEEMEALFNDDSLEIVYTIDDTEVTTNLNELCKEESVASADVIDSENQSLGSLFKSEYGAIESFDSLNIPIENKVSAIASLGNFLGPDWLLATTTKNQSLFTKLGILPFYNYVTKAYSFVILSEEANLNEPIDLLSPDGSISPHILGNVYTLQLIQLFKHIDIASTMGNIELFRGFLNILYASKLLNNTLNGLEFKIGEIICYSKSTGHSTFCKEFEGFLNVLQALASSKAQCDHKDLYLDLFKISKSINWLTPVEIAQSRLRAILNRNVRFNIESAKSTELLDILDNTENSEKIRDLQKLQNDIVHRENLFAKQAKGTYEYGTLMDISRELALLLAAYQGLNIQSEAPVSYSGASINELWHSWTILAKLGILPLYNQDGSKSTYFLGGGGWATTSANPSEITRKYTQLRNEAIAQLQSLTEMHVNALNIAYYDLIKANKTGLPSLAITGPTRTFWKKFFYKENGQITREFRLLNPYTSESDELTDADIEYLKAVTWDFVRWSSKNAQFAEFYTKPYKDLNNDEKLQIALEFKKSNNYCQVPLKPATSGTALRNAAKHTVKGEFKKAWSLIEIFLKKNISFDPNAYAHKTISEKDKKMELLKPFSYYKFLENSEQRGELLQNIGVDNLEVDLNYLTIDYIIDSCYMLPQTKLLELATNLLLIMLGMEDITGMDLSKNIENLHKYIKMSNYNTNDVGKDIKDTVGVIQALRYFKSVAVIGARPVLYLKEVTVGAFKNLAYTASGYLKEEGITYELMMKAFNVYWKVLGKEKIVNTITGKSNMGTRTLINALNDKYTIANRDSNILSYLAAASKRGLHLNSETYFWSSTAPDNVNRLSILIAKMMADGVWDEKVHYLDENGNLVYDMAEDPRYKIFWKYKDNPPEDKSTELFKKYLEQKALYNFMLTTFLEEGIVNKDGEPLKYGRDKLPQAYAQKEITSLKEIIGTLYGFLQHDEKAISLMNTTGVFFMHFKSWLTAELKHWFEHESDPTSRVKRVLKQDVEGNYLYFYEDEKTGKLTQTIEAETNEVPNIPIYVWTGIPTEGLIDGFIKGCSKLKTLEGRQYLYDHPDDFKMMLIFLMRMLGFSFISSLIAYLVLDDAAPKEERDAAENAVYVTSMALLKAAQDLAFIDSLGGTLSGLNIAGLDFAEDIANQAITSISNGSYEVGSLITKNIGAVKDFTK